MTMGKLRFIICVWFLFMCGSCLCSFVVENNSLKVSWPENLKGTYECALSSFGVPQHGGTLTGVVVYPKVNQKACNSFTHELLFKTKTHVGSLPVILLADRGDCYFSWKVRNAQNAGAVAILVADDNELLTTMEIPENVDGYNMENLTIPSAVITKSLGDSIKKALYKGEFVRVNLEWTEAFTRHDEQLDTNKININERESDYYDDQTHEHESDVHLPSHFIWRVMIKSSSFLGFRMMNMKSIWSMFLWETIGIIESVLKITINEYF